MLADARSAAAVSGPVDMLPFGDAARTGVDLMGQYAHEQKIVPRRYSAEELFAQTAQALA